MLSVVSVVCSQVEVSAMGRSLVQRSPTDYGVSLCVIYKRQEGGGPGQRWAVASEEEEVSTELVMWLRHLFKSYP